MKVVEFAKLALETDDEDFCVDVLWSCTCFPFGRYDDPNKNVRHYWRQLRHAKRSLDRGFTFDQIFEGKDILGGDR